MAYLKRKEFDVEKIIQLGVYEPLYVEECGKIKKWDYDRDMYCKIIRDAAEDYGVNVETKADFLCDFAREIRGLWNNPKYGEDYEINEDDDEETKNKKQKAEAKEKDTLRKDIERKHNRILKGMKGGADTVSTDKSCYRYLRKVEDVFNKSILTPIEDDKPFYHENKYLYSLMLQLIEIMYTSDIFNYVPNGSNFQRTCYRNHLNMIENNVKEIFKDESDSYIKWMEILAPFQQLIFKCNYPGIRSRDIWSCKCEELRFFDCSYEIAKNYELYCKVKHRLKFDLGNTIEEVNCELEACKHFFNENKQSEKKLFCDKMLLTLRRIVYEEFGVEV